MDNSIENKEAELQSIIETDFEQQSQEDSFSSSNVKCDRSYGEEVSLYKDRNSLLKENIEDLRHNREMRKKYAGKVFVFMCAWSIVTFAVLILSSWSLECFRLEVNTSVMITLLGGATINVISLVGIVVRGLFNGHK